MDVTLKSSEFGKELSLVQRIAGRKVTIPELAHVRLEAAGADSLSIVATDIDVALRLQCPARVREPGVTLLPAARLHDIVKLLPGDVRLQSGGKDGGAVKVTGEAYNSRLQTLDAGSFPTVAGIDGQETHEIPVELLRDMVPRVQYAVSETDKRYFLGGALVQVNGAALRMVATDGHRMAMADAVRDAGTGELRVLIPRKALQELRSLLELGDEAPVRLAASDRHIFVAVGGRELVSRTVEGEFPAYERILPKGNRQVARVDRDRLALAVRRVSLMSENDTRGVKFSFKRNSLTIYCASAQVGDADEQVALQYDGEPLEIMFQAQYVSDMLDVSAAGDVEICLKDGLTQALFRQLGESKSEYQCVIMPMRL
jgi:DNA polymerase-3 subunit beta